MFTTSLIYKEKLRALARMSIRTGVASARRAAKVKMDLSAVMDFVLHHYAQPLPCGDFRPIASADEREWRKPLHRCRATREARTRQSGRHARPPIPTQCSSKAVSPSLEWPLPTASSP